MKRAAGHSFHVSLSQSVRTRLTLWYLALMAFIIFIFGGSFYGTQTFFNTSLAESTLETNLYQDTQHFTQSYKQALLQQQNLTTLSLNQSSQEMVLLLDPTGHSLNVRGPLTSSLIQQLQTAAKQSVQRMDLTTDQNTHQGYQGWWNRDDSYRFLISPVLSQNVRIATLLVGLPHQRPIPFLAIWLFWGIVALLIAAVGGYWLADKALRPVTLIITMANEISGTDLRRRLHLKRKDEFGALAATFDQMLARLEAAFKRQTQFTADASHELRTPLTIMNLEITQALTQLERPEEYREVLEQIQAENEQMTAIVNSLLLLARVDTGQIKLDLQEVDLSDLALASVERLLPFAQQSQITLSTGELPELLIYGDPHYLNRMLLNLLENAIKYTGGVGERVRMELACEQEHWGVIRVQDDGPGIADEHLPLLFERFYRVDKARTRHQKSQTQATAGREEPGGTGLGLSIVQWIVQAHNGEIRVESKVGVGTIFEVKLPLKRAWRTC